MCPASSYQQYGFQSSEYNNNKITLKQQIILKTWKVLNIIDQILDVNMFIKDYIKNITHGNIQYQT